MCKTNEVIWQRMEMNKNNQIELLGLKYARSEIINSKNEFRNRLDLIEDRICKLEEKSLELIYIEGKTMEK